MKAALCLASVALVLATQLACTPEATDPEYALLPKQLQLTPVAWVDGVPKWASVAVLNETYYPLTLSNVSLSGVGSELLELQAPGGGRDFVLDVRESLAIQVRVAPATAAALEGWSTGTFDAELSFDLSGSGTIDPATLLPDPNAVVTVSEVVPVRFSLNCDVDGDGFDAVECGGGDCADDLVDVNPEAPEVCDDYDNDCDGFVDDRCTN